MRKIKKRLKSLYRNDLFLKVLAILISFILWLVVAIVISPEIDTVINDIPIVLDANAEKLVKLNLNVIDDIKETVDVTINGLRMDVAKISPEDLVATVSLDKVTDAGNYKLNVLVESNSSDNIFEITKITPSTVNVRFDRMETQTFSLQADTSKISVLDGYIKEETIITPSTIEISGPKVILSSIDKVALSYEQPEKPLDKSATINGKVVLLDKNGDKIPSDHIIMSIDSADITIPVLKMKTIPIKFKFINVPNSFDLSSLSYTMTDEFINIAGSPDVVDNISVLDLGYISLKDISPTNNKFVHNVNVENNGLYNISGINSVTVEFDMTGYEVRRFNVSNFTVLNEPLNYTLNVQTKKIYNVDIIGKSEVIDSITEEDIIAEIYGDAGSITPGNKSLTVSIVLPSYNAWAFGKYQAVVSVSEKEE